DLGRRERRITLHGKPGEREQPEQHDHDRDDGRENRTPDEQVADLGRVAHGRLLMRRGAAGGAINALSWAPAAALLGAGRYATGRAGCPGATFCTPSTTTRSPTWSPCSMSHDPPSQDEATTLRAATLSLSPTR